MDLNEIELLYQKPTTSIGTLEFSNYFDVKNGYKKLLKDWKYSYQKEFNFQKSLALKPSKKIEIPFMGELHGYGKPVYSNDRYLFPYLPPHIICKTSCQIFVHEENITLDENEWILQIEGIDNSYYLFVNQQFVGFSNISHCVQKFDVRPYLHNGKNEIRLLVLKFSSSSYLEDQDKIRLSGIFRNIYLIKRKPNYLKSFKIETDVDKNNGIVNITASSNISATISGFNYSKTLQGNNLHFLIPNAHLWNGEEPNLYLLHIECNGELIEQKVGIRKIEIINNCLYLNGRIIKMHGVNRHSYSLNGYAESHELMERDIELMKKLNINAVRTSHYPADPYFYNLCDQNGIYVISEADLETHGVVRQNNAYDMNLWDEVIANPVFYDQILERERSNVIINQNHPSIIMFSLGNESGFNHDLIHSIAQNLKTLDKRPLHYEGAYRNIDGKGFFKEKDLDVYSRMYPPIDYCFKEVPKMNRPFILCEYVHAMGCSLGEMKEYSDAFWSIDNFSGAFIWEWVNEYVLLNGKECYGGDFKESMHDGTFCVDGLIDPNRFDEDNKVLTPQVYEMRECYSPCEYSQKNGQIFVTNRYDFISLKDYTFIIEEYENGNLIKQKQLNLDVPSKETRVLCNDLKRSSNSYKSYTIKLLNKDNVLLSKQSIVYPPTKEFFYQKSTCNFSYRLQSNNLIETLFMNDKPIFKNMRFNLNRAYISNDIKSQNQYNSLRISDTNFYSVKKSITEKECVIDGYLAVNALKPFYKVNLCLNKENDYFAIKIKAKKIFPFSGPLRFGLIFELEDNYEALEYLGLEGESYCDRKKGNPFGKYNIRIEDNYRYIVPQNSNDHVDTIYIKSLKDQWMITSNQSFSFCYDCFLIKDYKKHRVDMKLSNKRYLFIDYKMQGVGTTSCGPTLQEKYLVNDDEINFTLFISKTK